MKLYIGNASYVGNVRHNNQDAVFFQYIEQKGQYFALGVVCDGIGGLEQGELASSFIIHEIKEWFQKIIIWLDIATVDPIILFAHLKDGTEEWNEKLCHYCEQENIRMGTTMSLIMIIKDRYYIVHIGDSRIYRYHTILEQLTTDACVSKMKNGHVKTYLDNYMGKSIKIWFQSLEGMITSGDIFLVCSDGFYHYLTVEDLEQLCLNRKYIDWNEICEELVKIMMQRGERDNISLGIIYIQEKKRFRLKSLIPWK